MSLTVFTNVQHAISLELLSDRLTEGATVLDVGSGSGYLTACMSIMVGDCCHTLYHHRVMKVESRLHTLQCVG